MSKRKTSDEIRTFGEYHTARNCYKCDALTKEQCVFRDIVICKPCLIKLNDKVKEGII